MSISTKISSKALHAFDLRLQAWAISSFFGKPFLIQGTVFAVLWLQGAIFDEREMSLTFQVSILQDSCNRNIPSHMKASKTLFYRSHLPTPQNSHRPSSC